MAAEVYASVQRCMHRGCIWGSRLSVNEQTVPGETSSEVGIEKPVFCA